MSIDWTPEAHKVVQSRPYTGSLRLLDEEDEAYFAARFELSGASIRPWIAVDAESNRYVLPFRGPLGALRGHILRMPWQGAPRKVNGIYPKADTFKLDAEEPLLAWYGLPKLDNPSVLVEDQLSAIKLRSVGISAIACLGKPISAKYSSGGALRVQELARYAPNLIIALDNDATADAFMFLRQWGPAFRSSRVAILDKDIKDTKRTEIHSVLGL